MGRIVGGSRQFAPDMLAPHQLTLALRHLTPAKPVDGVASLTLPLDGSGRPDLETLASLIARTYAAGLTPAVNLPAGSVEDLATDVRQDVLTAAAGEARGRRFLAGAFTGESSQLGVFYGREIERIASQGGTPVLVPGPALTALDEDAIADLHRDVSMSGLDMIAMEAGPAVLPFGRVYSLDLFQRLMDLPTLAGLLHASHDRMHEWYRLDARDARRPEFRIYSGHELALDMMAYGSDYVLASAGLSPAAFALRDRLWRAGDSRVTAVHDLLQYVASLVSRPPVGAYRHSIAQWLHARGETRSELVPVASDRRAASDLPLLVEAAERLDALLLLTDRIRPLDIVAPAEIVGR